MTSQPTNQAALDEAYGIIAQARSDFAQLHELTAGTAAHTVGLKLHSAANKLANLMDVLVPNGEFVERSGGHDKPEEEEA